MFIKYMKTVNTDYKFEVLYNVHFKKVNSVEERNVSLNVAKIQFQVNPHVVT